MKELRKPAKDHRGLGARNLPSGRSVEAGTIFAVFNTPKVRWLNVSYTTQSKDKLSLSQLFCFF